MKTPGECVAEKRGWMISPGLPDVNKPGGSGGIFWRGVRRLPKGRGSSEILLARRLSPISSQKGRPAFPPTCHWRTPSPGHAHDR